jgi:hypothetical protein
VIFKRFENISAEKERLYTWISSNFFLYIVFWPKHTHWLRWRRIITRTFFEASWPLCKYFLASSHIAVCNLPTYMDLYRHLLRDIYLGLFCASHFVVFDFILQILTFLNNTVFESISFETDQSIQWLATGWTTKVRFPVGAGMLLFAQRPHWVCGPPSFLFSGDQESLSP